MDTKKAMQIANLLKEQAEDIKEIAKDYEKGIISNKTYNFDMKTQLMMLETIVEEFKFNLKIKDAVNKDLL